MEIIAGFGLVSRLYFFSEGAGGASLALLGLFVLSPVAMYYIVRLLANLMKKADHRGAAAGLPLRSRWALRLGLRVPESTGEEGKGSYPLQVFLAAGRNIVAALALMAMTMGAAGLWMRPAWIFRVAPGEHLSLPFEAAEGNVYLMRLEGPCDAGAVLTLGAGDERTTVPLGEIAGSCSGGEAAATVVFRMTRSARPAIMVASGAGGSYRVVIVRRPVTVMGYLGMEILLLLVAFVLGEARRRVAPAGVNVPALGVIAGKGFLAASFTASFIAGFCAVWYLGIKALDRAFHFGIWITYDHFIQDIMRRFL